MTDAELFATVVTFVVMLVGVAGVVLPVLPDVWLIWLAALGYGLLTGFDGWIGFVAMLLLTALTVLGVIADLAIGPAVAARGGASWQAIAASIMLGLLGLFLLPPFGALAGALLGLFVVEYQRRGRNLPEAWQAVKSYAVGCSLSALARLAIAIAMIVIWGAWVWAAHAWPRA